MHSVVAVATAAVVVLAIPGGRPATDLPPPVLDGSAGYRFIHLDTATSLPSRFDPCAPVAYVVNAERGPEGAVRDVQEAFRRAELATGIRFVFEGEVDEVPTSGRAPYQPERYGERWAPVLVGWTDVDPADVRPGLGSVIGWAAHTPLGGGRQALVTTGVVALDAEVRSIRPGFGAGRRWGNVVLHEIGHLLGLDHAPGRGEVMTDTADHGAGQWGRGDLAGLAHLGREAGCLRVPRPADVLARP